MIGNQILIAATGVMISFTLNGGYKANRALTNYQLVPWGEGLILFL